MEQLTRLLTGQLAFVKAFLLFGAPSTALALGEFQGCGSVSIACGSFCTAWEQCVTGGGEGLCDEEWSALQSCISIPEVVVIGTRIDTSIRHRPPPPPPPPPPPWPDSSSPVPPDEDDDDEDEEEEEVQCGAGSSGPVSTSVGTSVVHGNFSATQRYGAQMPGPVELGSAVQQSIIDANLPREANLRDGSTANQKQGRYGVESSYLFVNNTVVEYKTTGCGPNDACCTTTFTAALDDGFWDVTDLPWFGSYLGCSAPDGIRPNCEVTDGLPYAFVPFTWTIEYDNPKRKRKKRKRKDE